MSIEQRWEDLSSADKDTFQRSCRKLLKQTFIVRDKDDENKKLYFFISRTQELITDYFSYIGFGIVIDRNNGVVMLRNSADFGEYGKIQANRIQLKKIDSIVLCCLWTIYADRLRKGCLSQTININISDLNFELEKYGIKNDMVDKTMISEALKLLSRYNLVSVKGKIGDLECIIRLYASLQFVMDEVEFIHFAENTEKRMLDTKDEENMYDDGE